ncbi:E3 ubiquitin-protein ligase HERC2 [Eurytemora carolleeae]|uniref:E3 ubiquitin-protein ligase HERC2 n=1 Tax=Eurytemora carolleeae TaxID=1294199 RepID=UPI000C7624E4|nr:E3 ubiquitin-protein ligase HERC2 [Eurytemora carolleeae]|eukprot:XP_023344096.1 E3 ubiquitin-protein ligase HERC2-like [Eurytemora affinis]
MDIYYAGFNGFKQVPLASNSDTLTCLTLHTKSAKVVDVSVCWNYLVVAEGEYVTKYGLVNSKPGLARLDHPPGSGEVTQLSATPRHILSVTSSGECWTHEEGKGWRRVLVETEESRVKTPSEDTCTTVSSSLEQEKEQLVILEKDDEKEDPGKPENSSGPENLETPIIMVKTACGDYHNLGLDTQGQAYSLPSPINVSSFPGAPALKVTDIACGKEHCMLLTETGQVFSWGGGTRGQLGHGTLSSEDKPRLIMALDGMRIKKIAAGGWHSAAISEYNDLYMFGWNESGQLALPTNLARPAECFSAVEKLLMACCTMQAEDAAVPRGDTEDAEVYRKPGEEDSICQLMDPEKEGLSCYAPAACENSNEYVMVQPVPILVNISGKNGTENSVLDVGCGSRHTVCLTMGNNLWSFGWNKYGQLGLGDNKSRDNVCKVPLPKAINRFSEIRTVRCGDWGTVILVHNGKKNK